MAACKRCKKKALVTDDVTGNTVCSSCGIVQAFTNFQHQFGDGANYVAHGTTGSGHDYSYRERKMYEAKTVIEDIVFRLGFAEALTREVKEIVKKVTEGEYGLGNWSGVLVGAACYIVMRIKNRVLTINEVCDVVGCELYEMANELPMFDVVGLLETTIKGFSGFSEVDEEKFEVMVKQGNFVVQCCIKWWLTTGRRPRPVAVAVLVFVAGMNEITVRIEEVAKEVNVGIGTCKLRYKELLEALVQVAKGCPWGNDINVKNIVRNAPLSFTKSGHKKRRVGDGCGDFDVNDALGDGFGGGVGDETNVDVSGIKNGSQPDLEGQGEDSIETVANLYSKFKADFTSRKNVNRDEADSLGDGLDDPNFQFFDEWWSGKSEMCENLFLNQLVEKDVGLNGLPPSYIRGCQSVKRRREKIGAAKTRINCIRFPSTVDSLCCGMETTNDPCLLVEATSHKKRKIGRTKREKHNDSIDWEDFIIETLLLHKVKEEEIEKGHYKALLGLYVFKG
ncbi:hypothetical protein RND81_04G078500 [Saponaria officinalis]|uniref:Uncharacterized protein n=1 Tax=Saponaria officinalis TaxID=3572 RepID=A0AAW1LM27_SAPOF